mgnify:CR=1 FL=1
MENFLLFLFPLLAFANYGVPSLNSSYSLGENIVLNSNITSPIISPSVYANYYLSVNNWATKGKFVEYIDGFLLVQLHQSTPYLIGVNKGEQFIDTDSVYYN